MVTYQKTERGYLKSYFLWLLGAILLVANIVSNMLSMMNTFVPIAGNRVIIQLLGKIILVALLGEIVCRKMILDYLKNRSKSAAFIAIVLLLEAIAEVGMYTFIIDKSDFAGLVCVRMFVALLGASLTVQYLRYHNLILNIILHIWILSGFCAWNIFTGNPYPKFWKRYLWILVMMLGIYVVWNLLCYVKKVRREQVRSALWKRILRKSIWVIGSVLLVFVVGLWSAYDCWYGVILPKTDVIPSKNLCDELILEREKSEFCYQDPQSNQCAGYATAYYLNQKMNKKFKGEKTYMEITPKYADGSVPIGAVVDYCRKQNQKAVLYTGSLDQIKSHINQGTPVLVQLRSRIGSDIYHLSVVVGYDEENIYLVDSIPDYKKSRYSDYNRVVDQKIFEKLYTLDGQISPHLYVVIK